MGEIKTKREKAKLQYDRNSSSEHSELVEVGSHEYVNHLNRGKPWTFAKIIKRQRSILHC